MSWIKWVARPDVPLKDALTTWAIGNTVQETNLWNYPELKKLPSVHIMYLGPLVHLDRERNTPLFLELVRIFKTKNSKCYLDLSDKYQTLAKELHDYLEGIYRADLSKLKNDQLLDRFEEFVKRYLKYAPVINSGAAGDWLYRTEYDPFIREMATRLLSRVRSQTSNLPVESRLFLENCLGPDDEILARIQKLLREGLSFSERRTFGEQKDEALWNLAISIEEIPGASQALIDKGPDDLRRVSPELYSKLKATWEAWKWTKMWSLPPTYAPSTLEEFTEEVKNKLSGGVKEQWDKKVQQRPRERALYQEIIKALALNERERDFIDSMNLLTYFRTWRMEVSSRATYLVTPLLLEMGSRLPSLSSPVDIVFLAPWEITESWKKSDVPAHLLNLIAERKQGYAVYQHDGRPEFFSGEALAKFKEKLLAVTNFRENGRGTYTTEEAFVGGKARNLFKLAQSNFTIPPFFVVTIEAFRTFIKHNNLGEKLTQLVSDEPTEENFAAIRDLFMRAKIPETVASAIDEQVQLLGLVQMAVRSSAATEDTKDKSWAGRFSSLMYIDNAHLEDAIKQVWASLLNPMARRYAADHKVDLLESGMAVIVQQMIDPGVSGVVNTVRSLRDPNIAEIEAALGLGEAVVSGRVTPDTYFVNKRGSSIRDKNISTQRETLDRKGWHDLGDEGAKQKLSDQEVLEVAKIASTIEQVFEAPQDIEFVVKDGAVHILQSRPQTGLDAGSVPPRTEDSAAETPKGQLVATGLKGKVETVFKGIARVILSPSEGNRLKPGEILVAPVATPVWDPILFRAGAIITDEGGATSHAIRVANERRIPAIAGTGDATRKIQDGQVIAIDTTGTDSFKGKVYRLGS